MAELRGHMGDSLIQFEYSPESFTGTELDYALEICQAVMDVWKPCREDQVIINLPATVEMSTPNVYADRIEWFSRHIENRESVILSVHTHNDRGTAVAAAELAIRAGAQRVEGALFGNGERTGNMDIMTMAMNLFSHGVDPRLDFSSLDRIREVYARCTRMDVHPRHPYAGDLVYTAFSGSHQDAIDKGLKAQGSRKDKPWDVPYLPIDPQDVGRTYESVIRINSQSGKGGVASVMERDWGYKIPKGMQPDFARVVQERTEAVGRELSTKEVRDCFEQAYLFQHGAYHMEGCSVRTEDNGRKATIVHATIGTEARRVSITAQGNGPVDAFVRGLHKYFEIPIEIVLYEEHALATGADAEAVAYIGIRGDDGATAFGVGVDTDISTASIKAVVSAINRFP
jgi:2-isopropylmalate synthase